MTSVIRRVAALRSPLSLCGLALGGMMLTLAASADASAQDFHVVVSIKPLHSLVSSLMDGIGKPDLIVKGTGSPHTYAMRPSDAAALQKADVVVWLGHDFETFLAKPLEALPKQAVIVSIDANKALHLLPTRESGTFEPHDDDAPKDPADTSEEKDLHLWLDPANAKAIAGQVASALAAADPSHASAYSANLEKLNSRLDTLDKDLATRLAPVRDKPFVVFHDAYQYFEKHYGLTIAGSITVSPETQPGATRLSEIHAKLKSLKAACVFAEPQFEPKLVDVVTEGATVRRGVLDPEGGTLPEGPDLYFQLMTGIADSLTTCLSQP